MLSKATLVLSLCSYTLAQIVPAQDLAAQFNLATSTSLLFPTATGTDAATHITQNWSLRSNRIQDGADRIQFVADPFPTAANSTISSNSTGPVLQVTYPANEFGSSDGGAQFQNEWTPEAGKQWQSMQITYDIAFSTGFDWRKGGKLPGLRGGESGCSGGAEPDGKNCFSTRLMWRQNAMGEVYAYIPRPNDLCDGKGVACNDDFGISLDRGSFGFAPGVWNRISMVVQMNNPPDVANGNLVLYFNNVKAFQRGGLQFRSATSLNINGMYFSTFFGGSDDSWATSKEEHTYFRNIQMWGSSSPSTLTGAKVVGSATRTFTSWALPPVVALIVGVLV